MTRNNLITVGMVSWNSALKLRKTLAALQAQEEVKFELILVDNDSADESVALTQSFFPDVKIICNPSNTGFCHAHNQAIQASKSAYYLALNPDAVLEPGYISILVDLLERRPKAGMAGGLLLRPATDCEPIKIDSTGLFINRSRRQYLRGHGQLNFNDCDHENEVFGIDGAAPLYRRAMLEDISFDAQAFDETFFAHKEDVDLAWRARLFGWQAWFSPLAVAYHPRSFRPGVRENVSPSIRLHAVKNRYLLLGKNETIAGWKRDWPIILSYDLKILTYMILFERSSLSAFRLVQQSQATVKRWRTFIQHKSRVNSAELLQWIR